MLWGQLLLALCCCASGNPISFPITRIKIPIVNMSKVDLNVTRTYTTSFASIGIGTPSQGPFKVILDTGSATLTIPQKGCGSCLPTKKVRHKPVMYSPKGSTTGRTLYCEDKHLPHGGRCASCAHAVRTHSCTEYGPQCIGQVCQSFDAYGDGSVVLGARQQDIVAMSTIETTHDFNMLSEASNSVSYAELGVDGLWGLGKAQDNSGWPDLLTDTFNANKLDHTFGLYMGPIDKTEGLLTIGGVDPKAHKCDITWFPETMSSGKYVAGVYKVQWADYGYSNNSSPQNPKHVVINTTPCDWKTATGYVGESGFGSILDSGTTLAYLTPNVYNGILSSGCSLKNSIVEEEIRSLFDDVFCKHKKVQYQEYYNIKVSYPDQSKWPVLKWFIRSEDGSHDAVVATPASHYLVPLSSTEVYFGAGVKPAPTPRNPQTYGMLLGDLMMAGYYWVFDRANKRVGVAPSQESMWGVGNCSDWRVPVYSDENGYDTYWCQSASNKQLQPPPPPHKWLPLPDNMDICSSQGLTPKSISAEPLDGATYNLTSYLRTGFCGEHEAIAYRWYSIPPNAYGHLVYRPSNINTAFLVIFGGDRCSDATALNCLHNVKEAKQVDIPISGYTVGGEYGYWVGVPVTSPNLLISLYFSPTPPPPPPVSPPSPPKVPGCGAIELVVGTTFRVNSGTLLGAQNSSSMQDFCTQDGNVYNYLLFYIPVGRKGYVIIQPSITNVIRTTTFQGGPCFSGNRALTCGTLHTPFGEALESKTVESMQWLAIPVKSGNDYNVSWHVQGANYCDAVNFNTSQQVHIFDNGENFTSGVAVKNQCGQGSQHSTIMYKYYIIHKTPYGGTLSIQPNATNVNSPIFAKQSSGCQHVIGATCLTLHDVSVEHISVGAEYYLVLPVTDVDTFTTMWTPNKAPATPPSSSIPPQSPPPTAVLAPPSQPSSPPTPLPTPTPPPTLFCDSDIVRGISTSLLNVVGGDYRTRIYTDNFDCVARDKEAIEVQIFQIEGLFLSADRPYIRFVNRTIFDKHIAVVSGPSCHTTSLFSCLTDFSPRSKPLKLLAPQTTNYYVIIPTPTAAHSTAFTVELPPKPLLPTGQPVVHNSFCNAIPLPVPGKYAQAPRPHAVPHMFYPGLHEPTCQGLAVNMSTIVYTFVTPNVEGAQELVMVNFNFWSDPPRLPGILLPSSGSCNNVKAYNPYRPTTCLNQPLNNSYTLFSNRQYFLVLDARWQVMMDITTEATNGGNTATIHPWELSQHPSTNVDRCGAELISIPHAPDSSGGSSTVYFSGHGGNTSGTAYPPPCSAKSSKSSYLWYKFRVPVWGDIMFVNRLAFDTQDTFLFRYKGHDVCQDEPISVGCRDGDFPKLDPNDVFYVSVALDTIANTTFWQALKFTPRLCEELGTTKSECKIVEDECKWVHSKCVQRDHIIYPPSIPPSNVPPAIVPLQTPPTTSALAPTTKLNPCSEYKTAVRCSQHSTEGCVWVIVGSSATTDDHCITRPALPSPAPSKSSGTTKNTLISLVQKWWFWVAVGGGLLLLSTILVLSLCCRRKETTLNERLLSRDISQYTHPHPIPRTKPMMHNFV